MHRYAAITSKYIVCTPQLWQPAAWRSKAYEDIESLALNFSRINSTFIKMDFQIVSLQDTSELTIYCWKIGAHHCPSSNGI